MRKAVTVMRDNEGDIIEIEHGFESWLGICLSYADESKCVAVTLSPDKARALRAMIDAWLKFAEPTKPAKSKTRSKK